MDFIPLENLKYYFDIAFLQVIQLAHKNVVHTINFKLISMAVHVSPSHKNLKIKLQAQIPQIPHIQHNN